MLDKNIIRAGQERKRRPTFERIADVGDVIKLAGRGGAFDLEAEFGISAERVAALDRVTSLAIAAGIDALRDAGIPLVMRYKTTTKGTQLPERWGLPDALRDDTGVIFGSAFPGYDSFAEIISGYYADRARRDELAMLEKWSAQTRERTLRHGPGGGTAHRRVARRNRAEALRFRPALPAPSLVDGAFAVRRIHRRSRSQHPNQCRLCDHGASRSVWRKIGFAPAAAAA